MMHLRTLFIFLAVSVISSLNAQNFLHTDGKAIVNESGDTIILRGMGLGGWMVQEGYMLQTSSFAGPQWEIRNTIEELIGPDNTDDFYEAWLANHVTKTDIDSLKSWGFNSVRLPMHYNLYTLSIQDEPVEGEHTWLDKGFEMTDSLLSWCQQNEMWVILDLHAAPGGQGYAQEISDYNPMYPSLWESQLNRDKTVALWKRLAERYAGEQWIGGYDLINETNWNINGGIALRNLYWEITDSIRTVDTDHIIFIEGNWFANDFTGLTPPWDDNLVYSPHKYWSFNFQADIQWVLDIQEAHNVPLYFGESGENSNPWFRDAITLMESFGIGWAWWPMKKVESISGPMSVVKTDNYQTLLDYWSNGGTAPSQVFATNTLMELADNYRTENCIYQKDVIDAMFRQVQTDEAIPFTIQEIPGIVHSSDYDLGPVGSAYFDTDLATYHVSTGNFTAWNNGWAYRNDGVDIQLSSDNILTNGYNIGWMATDEWMQYSVNVNSSAVYDINVRVASDLDGAKIHFSAGGSDVTQVLDVPNTGGWETWETVTFTDVILDETDKKIRLHVDEGTLNMGSFEFVETGLTTDLPTTFLTAKTLDQNTIQLSVNKPLEGPLPPSPSDFFLFVDGTTKPISNVELDADNQRIIRFTTGYTFTSSDEIELSYIGSNIDAQDGTALEMFILEPVQNNIVELHTIPGKIEAEAYAFQVGTETEETMDVGGGENIGFLDVGDYLDYEVNVEQAGLFEVAFRTASLSEGGGIKMQLIDDTGGTTDMMSINFPATGDWQSWTTTSGSVPFFSTGQKKIRIAITESLFNMNWFEFSFVTSTNEVATGTSFKVFPNPGSGLFYLEGDFSQDDKLDLEVYNILGQKIKSQQMATGSLNKQEINLRGLASSTYFIVLRNEKGVIHSERVVVK